MQAFSLLGAIVVQPGTLSRSGMNQTFGLETELLSEGDKAGNESEPAE